VACPCELNDYIPANNDGASMIFGVSTVVLDNTRLKT